MLSSILHGPKTLKYYASVTSQEVTKSSKKQSKEKSFWSYHGLMFDGITYPKDITFEDSWAKYTRAQKTILTIGHLVSQVENGGVWQYLFNKPELAIAALEALEEVNASSALAARYEKVLSEFVDILKSGKLAEIVNTWNDTSLPFEERWQCFSDGKKHLPSAKEFDDLLYDKKFKRNLFDDSIKYIEQNIGTCLQIKDISKTDSVTKKEAIPHFSSFLTETFNQEPEDVSIYYTGRVTLNKQATQLFLMKFKMPDGYESIGITGDFTYILPDLPISEINQMYKKYHKQELINLYHGCHLAHMALKKNPDATKLDTEKWEETLTKLQNPKNSQIPVNVVLEECFKYKNNLIFIYTGDLLYNDDKAFTPKDFTNVNVIFGKDRTETSFRGEDELRFTTVISTSATSKNKEVGFGRSHKLTPVTSKFELYDTLGSMNKIIKDNAWGF